ncbi:MAG: PBP1A family penicillin-binding protein [Caulobacteraceae bacterium]|nr:PBP1A family penicillin-binding protein [Caulobacteraceae bacterium]
MASGPAPKRKRKPLEAFAYWTAVAGVWGLIFLVAFLAIFARGLPDTSKLDQPEVQHSVTYLDRNGAVIAVRGSQSGSPVNIDELPPYVPAAFIAVEDRRFYHHPGFDPIGMMRALVRNARAGRTVEGGSTLTQQLARNLFLTPDQNMRRKIQEIMLAVWLEAKFSKKEILALYLNRVYFGAGAYGIEAASQRYFDKPARQLTVGEAALLAGLMKAPSRYSPVSESERAATRATVVLNEMERARVITPEQRAEAVSHPVRVSRTLATAHASYFVDWLDTELRALVGEPPEDLVVETTLDLPIQTAAERSVQAILKRDKSRRVEQAALVALDGEGRVRAMIGGGNYAESQFNRAVDARRQAGSAFKPFVYLAAMEAGMTPMTPVVDEPIRIGSWEPRNYSGRYSGPMNLQVALQHSVNTVAARVADTVGRDKVAAVAHRLGVSSQIGLQPSMALGAVEVSPLEMAQAYAPFANGGLRVQAHGINRIRTRSGRVLYQWREGAQDGGRVSVIANPPLSYMNYMMRSVMASGGTGAGAAISGFDLAGKTGTTSDYKDAWFVGYTGGFVTAVWVGKDDNKPMKGVSGGQSPAAIWKAFMTAALPRLSVGGIPAGPNPPANMGDPIGDLLDGMGEWFQGSGDIPPVEGATPPAADDPGRMDPIPNPEPEPRDDPDAVPDRGPAPPPPPEKKKKEDPLFF